MQPVYPYGCEAFDIRGVRHEVHGKNGTLLLATPKQILFASSADKDPRRRRTRRVPRYRSSRCPPSARARWRLRRRRLRLVRPASRRDARRGGRPRVVVSGPVDVSAPARPRRRWPRPRFKVARGGYSATSRLGSEVSSAAAAARRSARRPRLSSRRHRRVRARRTADADRRSAVDAAASRLERLNPTRAALRSPPRGRWEPCTHPLHPRRHKPWPFRPLGPLPDPRRGRPARRTANLPILNAVDADLTPTGASSVTYSSSSSSSSVSSPSSPAVCARRVSCHVPTRTSESAEAIAATSSSSAWPIASDGCPAPATKIRTRETSEERVRRSARRETRWTAGKTKCIPRMPRLELLLHLVVQESNPVWFVPRAVLDDSVSPSVEESPSSQNLRHPEHHPSYRVGKGQN